MMTRGIVKTIRPPLKLNGYPGIGPMVRGGDCCTTCCFADVSGDVIRHGDYTQTVPKALRRLGMA